MFSSEAMEKATEHPTLGPAYFEARNIVEKHMEAFQAEHFKPLLDEFSKQFSDKLWADVHDSLLSDTEMNLQGSMYRMVDDCIAALLAGDEWAIKRYALGEYRQEPVRAAIAKHIPKEIQDARIADLEKEVARLKERVRFHSDSY